MSFLGRLYIWAFTRSLDLICIRIQTLIKALYTHFRAIYRSADTNKSSGTSISRALRVIKERGTTYLLINDGGIRLSLWLLLYKLLFDDTTLYLLM